VMRGWQCSAAKDVVIRWLRRAKHNSSVEYYIGDAVVVFL